MLHVPGLLNTSRNYDGRSNVCFEMDISSKSIGGWIDVVAFLCLFVGRSFSIDVGSDHARIAFRYPVAYGA